MLEAGGEERGKERERFRISCSGKKMTRPPLINMEILEENGGIVGMVVCVLSDEVANGRAAHLAV